MVPARTDERVDAVAARERSTVGLDALAGVEGLVWFARGHERQSRATRPDASRRLDAVVVF
jgi:hypothetical protein